MLPLLSLSFVVVAAQAAVLTLQAPKLSVTDPTGSQIRSEPLSLDKKLSTPVTLGNKDTLKITFQVVDDESRKGVQPHQTFLRFYDPKSNEEGIQPVRVTLGGKAKFELNPNKPPLSLPPTPNSDPLKVTLIVGSSTHDPLELDLFDLVLPASQPAPQHPLEESFHPRPLIAHTFRPEHVLPPKVVPLAFSGIVLAPWLILLGAWTQVAPKATRLFSPSILPFIVSLGALEGLLFWYWVDLKLPQVLLYGSFLALPAIFTGRQALASIGSQRVSKK